MHCKDDNTFDLYSSCALSNPSLLWPSLPTPTERGAGDVLLCVPPQSAHVDRQLQQSADQHWWATVQCVGVRTYVCMYVHTWLLFYMLQAVTIGSGATC